MAKSSQVNVFMDEKRELSEGDRIQWRLVSRELQLKNAERGTVEKLEGSLATIRWDRGQRVQTIDLSRHKTWDHGYAETIYSAQSKTYDRVYVLAPVWSPLVTAQNFYTAITRARYGVKLWTQDPKKLVERLAERSGEKTSGLEGLGRIERDHRDRMAARQGSHLQQLKEDQNRERRLRSDHQLERELWTRSTRATGGRQARWSDSTNFRGARSTSSIFFERPSRHSRHGCPRTRAADPRQWKGGRPWAGSLIDVGSASPCWC